MSIRLDRNAPTRTPVAILMFNRPDLVAEIFAAVRAARPSRLLVVADGPRNEAERERTEATRAVIKVDWPCELQTNYSEQNLGCKRRVASGLDWVFEQCEEAIVLEDDTLPSRSFFPYCDALLEHYRDDTRVMCVSGMNLCPTNHARGDETYHLVRYGHTNGWASWRRAWQPYFDVELSAWPADKAAGRLRDVFPTQEERWFWTALLDRQYAGLINTWDYQWYYARWMNRGLTAVPSVNMVINTGFRDDATHTTYGMSSAWNAARTHHDLEELRHPRYVAPNVDIDRHYFHKVTNPLGVPGIAMSSARRAYDRLRGRPAR